MIEFSLSIDLGKKQEFLSPPDGGMPVDRAFVAQSLIAVAAKIQADKDRHGAISDDTGLEVGSWKFALLLPK
jgi:hypothetical protein